MGRSYSLVVSFACLVMCSATKAQGPYHIWLTGWEDGRAKMATEALLALDPDASVSVNNHIHAIVLHSTLQFTQGTLEQALAPAGFGILYATRNNPEGGQAPLDPESLAFPRYHDTGDPDQDNADYDEAKAAWIAAYPELYAAYKAGFFTNAPEE